MKTLCILFLGLLAAVVMMPTRGLSQSQPAVPIAEANTPQIQALARGLQSDPVQIFNYVHDHIQYVHYYGSKKGAQLTLLERSGNDYDQCALLDALLRAAGYTNIGYTLGWTVANYTNSAGNGVDLMHWLHLTLPNTNWVTTTNYLNAFFGARGFPEEGTIEGDSNDFVFPHVWVDLTNAGTVYHLDPSFKVSQYTSGINLTNAMGFSSNVLMSASVAGGTDTGNYVTNLNEANIRGALTGYTANLLNYIQSNAPNASVQQILGGWTIVPSTNTTLSQISQNFPLTTDHWDPFYYVVYEPTNLMATLNVAFAGTNYQWYMPLLQGQKITLTFSNNGLAQLWQEDTLLLQHSTSGSGTTNVLFTINQPFGVWNDFSNTLMHTGSGDQTTTNVCQSTNATYVINYAFEPDWNWLQLRQNQLDNYIQQGLPNTSRQVLSETLNIMGLNWLLETAFTEKLLAAQLGTLPQYNSRIGRMAQETGNGYYIDIVNQSGEFSSSGLDTISQNKHAIHYDMNAYFASALEHGIIEQFQSTNLTAASTIKMLEIANTNNQAVYLACSTNWTTQGNVESKLVNYNATILSTLTSYINAGYYVLLPQNGSNHVSGTTGWAGYGYEVRLQNMGVPMTNVTGMFVSGGYHGGIVSDPNATASTSTVDKDGQSQADSYTWLSFGTAAATGADPVDMADGTFQVEHTDLSLGMAEPRGITLTRYYNGTRRFSNPAGMAGGWIHNYAISANTVPAPQASLGGTTPAQAAAMIVATCAAANTYDSLNPDPKNWMVSALIAKWGIDQLNKNSASITLGKDVVQFIAQPNGGFTPPANCTMTLTQNNGAYSLLMRHGNQFNFNTNGVLNTVIDPYGNTLTLAYTNGRVQSITDSENRTLTFQYTGSQLTSVFDNSMPARTIQYGYSSATSEGDLTTFTDAEGQPTTYTYDTNHEITATIDAQSRLVVSNAYDGYGHVLTQYTQGLTNETWQLFWSGWRTVEQDPFGSERIFSYDNQTRLVCLQDQLGNLTQTIYDGQNHVVSTISPLNEINQFIYDGNNNLIEVVDALGNTNQLFYDGNNNLTKTLDPLGNTNTFGYDNQGSLTGQTNGAGDYVNFFYNSDGTLHKRTDALGNPTTYAYDTYGTLSGITYPGTLGSESFVNNLAGDPTSHTDANGNTTTFAYNNRRQLTNSSAPNNVAYSFAFDPEGNLASTTDPRNYTKSSTWSATRHLLSTTLPTTPQGTPVITNGYDSREWLNRLSDALGNPTLCTNDLADHLTSVTDPVLRTTTFSYDNDGRKITIANAGKETNSQTWDARGELIQLTDGAGHVSTRVYNAAGNQIALTNRNTNAWQFYFDNANRLTKTVTPLGYSAKVTFNHLGLVSTNVDRNNQPTTFSYDGKGRLTNRFDNITNTAFAYDANNNLTNVIEAGLVNAWIYDANNRVSSYRDVYGNLIQYRYDTAGNLTNLVYPGNKNVYYAYDRLNRMTNVTDWSGRKSGIAYDLNSHVTSIVRPNGSYRTISYDNAGQATNIMEQMANSLPIAIFKYAWTNTGSMAWEFAAPLPHNATVPTRTMAYDADNRLLAVNGTNVYSDADGNLTNGPLPNSISVPLAFDPRSRLLNAGGVTNVYDALNNRVGQIYGTNSIAYVVNPVAQLPQVLMRIKNGVTNYYVYGPGLLYQITETFGGTNTLTYHYDYRGSTIALSTDNGLVTDRIEYSLYGLTTYRVGTSDTPFLFNGRYGVQTDINGLLYMRARYYNPYLCRFVSADPSGFAGGLNFYAYCNGNPVSYLDPFGLGAVGENVATSWLSPSDFSSFLTYQQNGAEAADQNADTFGNALAFVGDAYQFSEQQQANQPAWAQQLNEIALFAAMALAPEAGVAAGAADTVANPVPSTLARIIPGESSFPTLGPPGNADVFVTDPAAIEGMTPAQISQILGIQSSDTYTVFQFPTPSEGLASPVFRSDPGFIGGGVTSGGAPEFVIPNGPIPAGATTTIIRSP